VKIRILKACIWWEGGYNKRELEPGIEVEVSENYGRYAVERGLAESLESAGEVKEGDVAAKDITNSGTAGSGRGKTSSSSRKRRG
jgi:hypothetical protein